MKKIKIIILIVFMSVIFTGCPNTEEPPVEDSRLLEIFDIIGGKSQYCNVDENGNYIVSTNSDAGDVEAVAYSQIGYTEKKSNNKLNSCTDNKGTQNYQKYSNFNGSWTLEFIDWIIIKLGHPTIAAEMPDNIPDLIDWAKTKGKWKTRNLSNLSNDGCNLLVFDVGSNYYGIGVIADFGKNVIIGDYANKVSLISVESIGYDKLVGVIEIKKSR